MVKLDSINKIEKYENNNRYVQVSLTADTADEVRAVGTDGSQVPGLLARDIITAHSDAFTADKQLLILNSSGVGE